MNRKTFACVSSGLAAALATSTGFAQFNTKSAISVAPLGGSMGMEQSMGVSSGIAGVPLVLTTGNGQQQIEIEVGPLPGEVRVFGISGIPSGDTFVNVASISLTTGRAQDYVEFRVYSTSVPPITVNTGAGLSDVKFIYFTPETLETVSTSVTVIGGTAADKVDFLVESLAAGFSANWTVQAGAGDNETKVTTLASQPSELMSITLAGTYGNGFDKIEVGGVVDAATATLNLSGSLAGGEDFVGVALEQLGLGAINASYNLDLGAARDAADITLIGRGGLATQSGSIRGGAQDDTLVYKVEADGDANVTLDGGDGNDYVDFFGKGNVTGTPRLLGGLGNDELKLVIDGPQIATPFIDGGAGFDIAIGFGTIVNCEQIN